MSEKPQIQPTEADDLEVRRQAADRNYVQDRERRERDNLRNLTTQQNDFLRAAGERI